MRKIETGGPAFPCDPTTYTEAQGMTLRTYFAAKALQGLLGGQWPDSSESKEIVRRAFALADLMVEAGK
jgi:hypothetical protein